jgi:hypothetical protein
MVDAQEWNRSDPAAGYEGAQIGRADLAGKKDGGSDPHLLDD